MKKKIVCNVLKVLSAVGIAGHNSKAERIMKDYVEYHQGSYDNNYFK